MAETPVPHLPFPTADEQWARKVIHIQNARIDPEYGTVFSDGRRIPEAAIYRWDKIFKGWRDSEPESTSRLPGRHLWGGTLFYHFGHFLTESLSRLWAVEKCNVDSIIFTPKGMRGKRPEHLSEFQEAILNKLGVHIPVRTLYEPVEVEELFVPGQGFGLGTISRGTPEFRNFAGKMASEFVNTEPSGATKLYLSRSKLSKKNGSVLAEAALEAALVDEGFRIFHPQEHTIAEQLQAFRAARKILGPDGSAFHLAGFVALPEQEFIVIKRRTAADYLNICRQLEGMGGRISAVDALVANWLRPGKVRPDDMSWGEVDYHMLSKQLQQQNFISRPLQVVRPDHTDELDLISRAHKGFGLQRIPIG